jgi:hypothetical protein
LVFVIPAFAYFSDEQFIKAEDVEAGHLRLEHDLGSKFVRLFFQRFIQKLRDGFQDPKDLSVELFVEVTLGDVFELEGVDCGD